MATYQRLEKNKAAEYKKISVFESEVITKNKAFMMTIILLNNFLSKKNGTNIKDNKANNKESKPRKNKHKMLLPQSIYHHKWYQDYKLDLSPKQNI